MNQIRSSIRRVAEQIDGEFAACCTVAAACFLISGTGWLVNQLSPGSTQLSAMAVPGFLYLALGARRAMTLRGEASALKSQVLTLPADASLDVASQTADESSSSPTVQRESVESRAA